MFSDSWFLFIKVFILGLSPNNLQGPTSTLVPMADDFFDSGNEDNGPPTDFGGRKYIEIDEIPLQVIDPDSEAESKYSFS